MTDDAAWAIAMRNLARELRVLRHRAGISQDALARAAGISQGGVSRLESGTHTDIPLLTLVRVVRALSTLVPVLEMAMPKPLAALLTLGHDFPIALRQPLEADVTDPDFARLLDAYHACSPARRSLFVTMALPLLHHLAILPWMPTPLEVPPAITED